MLVDEYKTSKAGNTIAFAACCYLFYQMTFLKKEWVLLDNINLAFHEAGHVLFSWGGEVLHFAGGTLGQLLFPLLFAILFFARREIYAGLIMSFWFFQNGNNIARYIEDAIVMKLPLVGGGIHDWNWLLTHFRLIHKCYDYGKVIRIISLWGMSATLLCALFVLIRSFVIKKEARA